MKDWEMNGVEVHDMKFPKVQLIDSQALTNQLGSSALGRPLL